MMSHSSLLPMSNSAYAFVFALSSNLHRKHKFRQSCTLTASLVWNVTALTGAFITCYGGLWPVTVPSRAVGSRGSLFPGLLAPANGGWLETPG